AAQRTVVTCSLAGLTGEHIGWLVDKNPYLHGLYTPGAHLRIDSPDRLRREEVDALVIFASSFEAEIVLEQRAFAQQGGRFISLFPEPRYLA
ncbi:MAG: hypothetical protein HY690_04015, partial [Chloroflexi bacterium]|nr:hypothetical protein [Chloroflexota bacterium]